MADVHRRSLLTISVTVLMSLLGAAPAAHAELTEARVAISCPVVGTTGQRYECDVTVLDNSLDGTGKPTGTVTFSSNSTGAFDAPSCTLAAGGCTLGYTPAVSGNHTLTATYAGDATYSGTYGLTGTAVLNAGGGTDAFRLACVPTTPTAGTPVTCTATATLVDLAPSAAVSFTSTGAGTFAPHDTCGLVGGTCAVTFTPSAPGLQTVLASLQGDSRHMLTAPTTITVGAPLPAGTGTGGMTPPAGTGATTTPTKVALSAPRTQKVVRRAVRATCATTGAPIGRCVVTLRAAGSGRILGRGTAAGKGTATQLNLTVKLTAAGRKLLGRATRPVKLTLSALITPAGGTAVAARATTTVRPPAKG